MSSKPHTDEIYTQKRKPKYPIKFSLQLNEEQKQAKALIVENPIVVLKGMAGSGKAQPLTSTVYTPQGPVLMGDLKVGQQVLGKTGTTTILGIYPQGVEDVYEITTSDKSKVRASSGHLWTVCQKKYSHKQTKWEVKTTQELLEDLERGVEYRLPEIKVAEFESKEVPLDPYLLGILLAEGHLRHDTITFSTSEEKVLESIVDILKETNTTLTHIENYDYRFEKKQKDNSPNYIDTACRELGLTGKLSYDKFIPHLYKYNSEEVRIKLLQGLLDGDGYIDSQGFLLFNTNSKELSKDVTEVFQSLGAKISLRTYFPKYTYLGQKKSSLQLHYQLSITVEAPKRFVTLPHKLEKLQSRERKAKHTNRIIKDIQKIGQQETQCIKVDAEDSLYLTDHFIVTHNTLVAVQAALDMYFSKEIEKIVITRPTVSKEDIGFLPGDLKEKMDPWLAPIYHNLYMLYNKEKIEKEIAEGNIEIVPFAFMRGRTFVNSLVIVDEAQNVTHNQMEAVIGRLGKNSKMVICGDLAQIDLQNKKETGFSFLSKIEAEVPGFKVFALKQNHRHDIVSPILQVYRNYED